jgi:hypothetical protein
MSGNDIHSRIEKFYMRAEDEREGEEVPVHHVAHAKEDVVNKHNDDRGAREPAEDIAKRCTDAENILSTPEGAALQERAFDILENATLAQFGKLERPLKFLSRYPATPYTYQVRPTLFRGSRPTADELSRFHSTVRNFGATINLCDETPHGDAKTIAEAGLTNEIENKHIGIVDMERPSVGQVVELLEMLRELDERGKCAYMHCEAGKGRTGVMTACVRMATMGWSMPNALKEARNFGCQVPAQIRCIQDVGAALGGEVQDRSLSGYPVKPLGATQPSDGQLSETLESAAAKQRAAGEQTPD